MTQTELDKWYREAARHQMKLLEIGEIGENRYIKNMRAINGKWFEEYQVMTGKRFE